ncbi:MAG: polysaccharide deacetylase family protein [Clostridia bacterium]|nr:polysaccharide deacetylase family protein [Clostridia bacterium]
MRIYVIKASNFFSAAILASMLILIITAGFISSGSSHVSGASRDLPIYSVNCPEKKVAITFDCAWGASDIPKILDTLEKEDVKATFFIVGQWAEKYPDAVRMMAEKGHDVANHSYSHLRMGALDKERLKSEITKCGDVLNRITRKKIELMRPPYGDYSNNTISVARSLGYYTIQWDVDSLDWKPGISPQEIANRVMRKARAGSIILFHNDTPHTANILPNIITALKKQGYSFEPVSKLIMRENYFLDFEGRQQRKP